MYSSALEITSIIACGRNCASILDSASSLEAAVPRISAVVITCRTASAFAGEASGSAPERFSLGGWLNDLAGRTKNLVEEIAAADLVVMVASAGESAGAAAIIGEACAVRHVMTTALILGTASSSDEVLSKLLAQLRPHAIMLVISSADEYIKDMLTALRA